MSIPYGIRGRDTASRSGAMPDHRSMLGSMGRGRPTAAGMDPRTMPADPYLGVAPLSAPPVNPFLPASYGGSRGPSSPRTSGQFGTSSTTPGPLSHTNMPPGARFQSYHTSSAASTVNPYLSPAAHFSTYAPPHLGGGANVRSTSPSRGGMPGDPFNVGVRHSAAPSHSSPYAAGRSTAAYGGPSSVRSTSPPRAYGGAATIVPSPF